MLLARCLLLDWVSLPCFCLQAVYYLTVEVYIVVACKLSIARLLQSTLLLLAALYYKTVAASRVITCKLSITRLLQSTLLLLASCLLLDCCSIPFLLFPRCLLSRCCSLPCCCLQAIYYKTIAESLVITFKLSITRLLQSTLLLLAAPSATG